MVWEDEQLARAQMRPAAPAAQAAEYWRGVLTGSAHTPVPQWSAADHRPELPVAVHRTAVPAVVATTVRALAERTCVPLEAVLIAATARVLAAVTGERTVVAGYLPPDAAGEHREPLPCALSVADGTWQELLAEAGALEAAADWHRPAPLDELRAELGRTGPLFDTVVVAGRAPDAGDLDRSTVLAIGLADTGEGLDLVLAHRTAALDPDAAGRIAGYLLAALDLLGTRPHDSQHRWNPVSEAEAAFQRDTLAGPERPRPDLRFHQLFEEQVRLRPDEVAAEHDGRTWTYRELNRRANRIAHALCARGIRNEDVIAVVTERDLDWLAAVIAVFKAGGAYLPIEPHFPGDRIASMLGRSSCRQVLTQRGASAGLTGALAELDGVEVEFLADLDAEELPEGNLDLPVAADQLAYLYFTSGSTGQPKGAMCEHAGFLNHLLAKIEDLGIEAGTVVAQTAPQCFDISLWQLVAAPAVGGRTVIVGQQDVLDVSRFVSVLDGAGVEVAQLVPSYLEVVLDHLRRNPRGLPRLRCVSVTGEAIKKELTERWFEAFPGVALVNAYGLTETSDDTNHEVMLRPPAGAGVPLGRPIANVRVSVVDEWLRPVPLGAPGEIVFSGVCVGRGYVNDEERTRAAFVPDPHRDGERRYLSGDFGRWTPAGRLEFLGRRDAQVKIRGFRIEMGEIENQLLRVDGVRDAAVVVAGPEDDRRLAAFYAGPGPLPAEEIRTALARSLPDYMMPGHIQYLAALPLTPNGKIDRRLLTALAATEVTSGARAAVAAPDAPRTDTERRLAELWSKALRVPVEQIGRSTNFFQAGGTSIAVMRLAIALDRAIPAPVLAKTPVLSDVAALLDRRPQRVA